MELHTFEDSRRFATALAAELGCDARGIELHRFPDGESRVRVCAGGAPQALLVRALDGPNPKLLEVLLAADALREGGVGELTLVAPYLPYMRQDQAFREGEAVSQRVVGRLLGSAFDRVLTVEAHLHRAARLADVFPCEAESISAARDIGRWCRSEGDFDWIIGPDAESKPWVQQVAETAGLPSAICEKVRRGDRDVAVQLPSLPESPGRALIVDDMASTGATLVAAARGLYLAGFERVEAMVAHALLDRRAERRLRDAGIARILSTDTIPHRTNRVSVVRSVADALREFAPLRSAG